MAKGLSILRIEDKIAGNNIRPFDIVVRAKIRRTLQSTFITLLRQQIGRAHV